MASEPRLWLLLADLTLVVHAAYVLFVIGGLCLILIGWARGWAWIRHRMFRVWHLVAMVFVMLEAWLGAACPLTTFENFLRSRAGSGDHAGSFVGYWLGRVIFYAAPEWLFTVIYTVFVVLVLLVWIVCPPRRKL